MKNLKLFFAVFIVIFVILSGCQKNEPTEPQAAPTNTSVLTSTPTVTYTPETPTSMPTDTATSTYTATPTDTATSTPTDYIIDDFEDGLNSNPFTNDWIASPQAISCSVSSWGVVSSPLVTGAYAMEVTGTVVAATFTGAGYFGSVSLSTGPTAGANVLNVSGFPKIKCVLHFKGIDQSVLNDPQIIISLYGSTGAIASIAINTFLNGLSDYSFDLSTFSVAGGTINDVLANLNQIYFQIRFVGSGQNEAMDFEFVLDNLRFGY